MRDCHSSANQSAEHANLREGRAHSYKITPGGALREELRTLAFNVVLDKKEKITPGGALREDLRTLAFNQFNIQRHQWWTFATFKHFDQAVTEVHCKYIKSFFQSFYYSHL